MVLTPSRMMPLGAAMPDFRLPEPRSGQSLDHETLRGEHGLLLMFICNHCPFVQHIEEGLLAFGRDYAGSGIGIAAISANDAEQYPEDAPEKIAERAQTRDYPFPYLYDESQQVARSFDAACTPDFFLFDRDLRCVYRGRFDEARPNSPAPVTGADLRLAMDALLAGQAPDTEQHPSVGCNIKWRSDD